MKTNTQDLLNELKNTDDIQAFFNAHENDFLSITLSGYLNELLSTKDLSIAEVSAKSGVGEYLYKVFKGERKPSRDIIISIAFGMELTLPETQLLLRISKFAVLDPRDKRDSIIIYCITNGTTVFKADDMLDENSFTTIN